MKKVFIALSAIIISLVSCEKSGTDTSGGTGNYNVDSLGSKITFQIGDLATYPYSDISLYDSSTHILYFRENHPEFQKLRQTSFTFYSEGEKVYDGEIWPGYSSSLPSGPYIATEPLFYQNYALRIDFRKDGQPDLRNDPKIIKSMMERDLLHSGLQVTIMTLNINSTFANLALVVTNMDKSALYILDPDKMGHKLFHYFTNGLYLRDLATNELTGSILEFEPPVVTNAWSKDWLTLLGPDQSAEFILNYNFRQAVPPGNYLAVIEYPGLSNQVNLANLFQSSGRIWLGDVTAVMKISVQ
jgi:hypothetical protein